MYQTLLPIRSGNQSDSIVDQDRDEIRFRSYFFQWEGAGFYLRSVADRRQTIRARQSIGARLSLCNTLFTVAIYIGLDINSLIN